MVPTKHKQLQSVFLLYICHTKFVILGFLIDQYVCDVVLFALLIMLLLSGMFAQFILLWSFGFDQSLTGQILVRLI